MLLYFSLLLAPFAGLALANYTPPDHHISDDIYQVPDSYQIRDDIYIVPEDPYNAPDDSYDPNQQNDQQHNAPDHNSPSHNTQDQNIRESGDHNPESAGSGFEISWTGIGKFIFKEVVMGTFDLIADPSQWRNIDWKNLDWKSLGFSTVKSAIGELLPGKSRTGQSFMELGRMQWMRLVSIKM